MNLILNISTHFKLRSIETASGLLVSGVTVGKTYKVEEWVSEQERFIFYDDNGVIRNWNTKVWHVEDASYEENLKNILEDGD